MDATNSITDLVTQAGKWGHKAIAITDHGGAQAVFDIVHQTSAIQKAQDLAAKYTNKALKGIAKLPDNQVQTKENLARLTKAILTREN